MSEAIFGTMFALFVVWTFSPFVSQQKRFYTAVMWSRLLMVLVGESESKSGGQETCRETNAQGQMEEAILDSNVFVCA